MSKNKENSKKLRILCLHGNNSNNDITQFQTMGLKLSEHAQCDYLHAPHQSTDAAAGLDAFTNDPFYTWTNNKSVEEWKQSLQHVVEYTATKAPFDGIYGFSQGAALVTSLCNEQVWRGVLRLDKCPFSFAILACGGGGVKTRHMISEKEAEVNGVPSFHIMGKEDSWREESVALEQEWDPSCRTSYTHSGGHEVPMMILKQEPRLGTMLQNFLTQQQEEIKAQAAAAAAENGTSPLKTKQDSKKVDAEEGCHVLDNCVSM